MKKALLYCPNLDGHRMNYLAVVARWFISRDFHVHAAIDSRIPPDNHSENVLENLQQAEGFTPLHLEKPSGATGDDTDLKIRLREFLDIEAEVAPEWTFFPAGDELECFFRMLSAPVRSHTRRVAVIIGGKHVYKRDYRDLAFPGRLRNGFAWLRFQAKQNAYCSGPILRDLHMDRIIFTNEHLFSRVNHPGIFCMPEIYRAWTESAASDDPLISKLTTELDGFLTSNSGKDPIIYYGGRAVRRGYHRLMRLAAEHSDCVFISIGRATGDMKFDDDVDRYREVLERDGRIFLRDIPFLPENRLVDMMFHAADYVLLPYENFYGLSGILIQAASYARPVLVPDIGYMGSATVQHGLGSVFRHKDYSHMKKVWRFLRSNHHSYHDSLVSFSDRYSYSEVQKSLDSALLSA